jgi:hypothetical protein
MFLEVELASTWPFCLDHFENLKSSVGFGYAGLRACRVDRTFTASATTCWSLSVRFPRLCRAELTSGPQWSPPKTTILWVAILFFCLAELSEVKVLVDDVGFVEFSSSLWNFELSPAPHPSVTGHPHEVPHISGWNMGTPYSVHIYACIHTPHPTYIYTYGTQCQYTQDLHLNVSVPIASTLNSM